MRKKEMLGGCVVWLGIALLIVAALLVRPRMPPFWGNAPFNRARWAAGKGWRPDNVRQAMVRSLLTEHRLVGLSRWEIRGMLGPPDGTEVRTPTSLRVPESEAMRAREWHYILGVPDGPEADYYFLVVQFSQKGTVRRWVIRAS